MRLDLTFKDLLINTFSTFSQDHWLVGWCTNITSLGSADIMFMNILPSDLLRVEAVSIKSQITSQSGSISSSELMLSWSETLFV